MEFYQSRDRSGPRRYPACRPSCHSGYIWPWKLCPILSLGYSLAGNRRHLGELQPHNKEFTYVPAVSPTLIMCPDANN